MGPPLCCPKVAYERQDALRSHRTGDTVIYRSLTDLKLRSSCGDTIEFPVFNECFENCQGSPLDVVEAQDPDDPPLVEVEIANFEGEAATLCSRESAPCPADVNLDYVLDLADYFLFFDYFDNERELADLNADGVVDLGDFFIFLDFWANGC